jgi:Ni/Fe-hydrogenase subunit HybB-like protein
MEDKNKPKSEAEEARMLRVYNEDLLPRKFGKAGKIWVTFLITLCALGLYSYIKQLKFGLGVTGMGDTVSWGIYISNFVFFVAVSLVGSLITAVLYLLNVKWRAPLTRISEIIAVSAIIFASLIIIVDMGRPDRLHHILLYGRIQSPIIWDIMVVTTYMTISLMLLYFPLIPGIAYCRDNMKNIPKWQQKMYKILAIGWSDKPEQYKLVKKAVAILSVTIIPVAMSIHTVTSWLFATTYRPGWDSTNLGAYFVAGAFMVGAAAVIAAMFIIRRFYKQYSNYITDKHFDLMGKLLVLLSFVYLYFSVNEYLIPGYKMKGGEAEHLEELFTGHYAPMFWLVQIFGMIVPIIVLLFKKGRKPLPIFIIALLVIVGAWFKRYLIVIPTMLHTFLPLQEVPDEWMHYMPTFDEWAITLGSLGGALLLITIFVRYFPVISSWEVAEEKGIHHDTIYKHMNKPIEESNKIIEGGKSNLHKISGIIILLICFLPTIWSSQSAYGVSQNEAEITETENSEKQEVSMSLTYKIIDGEKFIKVKIWYKEGRNFIPVSNVITNLYLNEVKKRDSKTGEGWISNLVTDENGEGLFPIEKDFYEQTKDLDEFTFIATMNSDPLFEDIEEEISVMNVVIKMDFVTKDSITTVTATLFEADGVTPIPETELKFMIKRHFSLLPFGDEFSETDEDGMVSAEIPADIPGSLNGTLIIVAKIDDHYDYGTVEVSQEIPWHILPKINKSEKRTLWSSGKNVPFSLIISSVTIIFVIWGILIYLVSILFKIKRLSKTT